MSHFWCLNDLERVRNSCDLNELNDELERKINKNWTMDDKKATLDYIFNKHIFIADINKQCTISIFAVQIFDFQSQFSTLNIN